MGKATSTPERIMGAVIMKMISRAMQTSTRLVMFMESRGGIWKRSRLMSLLSSEYRMDP